jgi:hypothetical protein
MSKRVDQDLREPTFFANYDYTEAEPNETSPGGGLYHGDMGKYKSVSEFIRKRRRQRGRRLAALLGSK